MGMGCFQMVTKTACSPLGTHNKMVVSSINLDPPQVDVGRSRFS